MVVTELKKTFEKRRSNLINILENPDAELELAKQHQIYGAIKEIENFLRTLDHLRELELHESVKFQLSNDEHISVMNRLTKGLRK
ncbi:MAG: hypothetical protein KKG59_07895 [Nanoarchaeota archaeon]|nr:hypothetical protein [Nanoarchaeota archaeon]